MPGIGETLDMPKKEAPKRDLTADHAAAIRLPRGHWDAFVIYCQREGLSHKDAMSRMIEEFVGRTYLEFVYGPMPPGHFKHAKGQTRSN